MTVNLFKFKLFNEIPFLKIVNSVVAICLSFLMSKITILLINKAIMTDFGHIVYLHVLLKKIVMYVPRLRISLKYMIYYFFLPYLLSINYLY